MDDWRQSLAKVIKPLNIKHPEAYRLARKLADQTGESLTHVVVQALREKMERERRRRSSDGLVEAVRAIQRRVAELPVLDSRSDEEILGYNQYGGMD